MSIYNMLFGTNPNADCILATLNLTREDVGRFRDCFVRDGKIEIYTRNGGGNREAFQCIIDDLATHPNYLFDEDDEYDRTYATIYFSFPEAHADALLAMQNQKF